MNKIAELTTQLTTTATSLVIASPEAVARKEALLNRSAEVFAVKNAEDLERAVAIERELRRLDLDIEKGRKEITAPILDAKKQIDDFAKQFGEDVGAEILRVGALVVSYRQEEANRLRAEREAQERERQRIERERQQAEAEARRKAADAERIAREAREAQERAERQAAEAKNAEERKRAEAAAAELRRVAEEARQAEMARIKAEEEAKLVAQHSELQLERIIPSAPVSVEGQRQEMEILPEVLDHAKVYARFPHAYDLAKSFRISVIKNEIAAGRVTMNNCPPGLRLREELVVRTAAARKPKTKEIEA